MTSPTRALIAQLEALAEHQVDLQARLIEDLKGYAKASEASIDAVERHMHRTTEARSSVIAEAACLLVEHETGHSAAARLEMAYAGRRAMQ